MNKGLLNYNNGFLKATKNNTDFGIIKYQPDAFDPKWIQWHNGIYNSSVGTGGADFIAAVMFSTSNIESLNIGNKTLSKISVYYPI